MFSEVVDQLLTEKPSFCHWQALLDFYVQHHHVLSVEDRKRIIQRCEDCRLTLDKNPINKNDINPNIYQLESDCCCINEKDI